MFLSWDLYWMSPKFLMARILSTVLLPFYSLLTLLSLSTYPMQQINLMESRVSSFALQNSYKSRMLTTNSHCLYIFPDSSLLLALSVEILLSFNSHHIAYIGHVGEYGPHEFLARLRILDCMLMLLIRVQVFYIHAVCWQFDTTRSCGKSGMSLCNKPLNLNGIFIPEPS